MQITFSFRRLDRDVLFSGSSSLVHGRSPVLLDVKSPAKLEMGLIVVIDKFGCGIVVTPR
jgi:hypothetical protein